MIEALMLWNEPNNISHWDRTLDPEWAIFSRMCTEAADEIRARAPDVRVVLGGMSPIDAAFLHTLSGHGALRAVDTVAVHGFPYDWNLWPASEWPEKIREIHEASGLPVWITETGVSSWASDANMVWGLRRMAPLLRQSAERVHWYSLYDLDSDREATTRHGRAEGSSYWRHFHFGLLRADGSPKPALEHFDPRPGDLSMVPLPG